MAQNSSDGVTWFLTVPSRYKHVLGSIRHWDNLKMAIDGEVLWVKDFTTTQIESTDIKILPFKEVFYSRGAKLFPHGSGLPQGNVPSLLWSPIDRGLQVSLPAFNHNYFGVQEKANALMVRTEHEITPVAMLVSVESLRDYLETAPSVRLNQVEWVLVGERAFLRGTPLLPLNGEVYWQKGQSYIPAGYDLDLPVLSEVYDSLLSAGGTHMILWDKNSTYTRILLNSFRPLSIGSFRNSIPV